MGLNWQDVKTHQRLIAALLAAHPEFKPNYAKIAFMFGHNATYDSIEGRFRPARKTAAQLRQEAESGVKGAAPKRGTRTKATASQRSSQQSSQGTISGKVTKSQGRVGGKAKKPVKEEIGSEQSFEEQFVDYDAHGEFDLGVDDLDYGAGNLLTPGEEEEEDY
ncbi:MAG: hypothetical protein M1824_005379 [Vezdaea acicularis]|nr:MAG: hypothetical protein M1824_005379 [Vezdaea acicularis]